MIKKLLLALLLFVIPCYADVIDGDITLDIRVFNSNDNLAQAIAYVNGRTMTILFTSTYFITADTVVPANITLAFQQAGQISVKVSRTLTINGHIFSDNNARVVGFGNVIFNPTLDQFNYSSWFGNLGTITNNSSFSFNPTTHILTAVTNPNNTTISNTYVVSPIFSGTSTGNLTGLTSITTAALTDTGSITTQDIITKGPWVDVRAYASFASAVTAIGSSPTTLLITNNQTISTSVTVPSTLNVQIIGAGSFTKSGSGTITFNGGFTAPFRQVFSNFGLGDIQMGFAQDFPEWWGALGDGTTNDADAFRYAIAASLNVHVSGRTYIIGKTSASGNFVLYLGTQGGQGNPISRNGITIEGDGNKSVIKLINAAGNNILLFSGAAGDSFLNMTFKNFLVDLNGQNNLQVNFGDPLRYNQAFYFFNYAENILFENIYIKNISGSQGILIGGNTSGTYGKHIILKTVTVDTFGIAIPSNNQPDVSAVFLQADDILIDNFRSTGPSFSFNLSEGHTALELHGDVTSTKVVNSHFERVQMPILLVADFKSMKNVLVDTVTMTDCNYMASLDPSGGSGFEQSSITFNNITYQSTLTNSYIFNIGSANEAAMIRKDISVRNSTISTTGNANQGLHFIHLENNYLQSLIMQGNTFKNLNGPVLVVTGIVENSGILDVTLDGNKLDSLGATSGIYPSSPAFVATTISSGTIYSLRITNNKFLNSLARDYTAFGLITLTGAISYTYITNNEKDFAGYTSVNDAITSPVIKNIAFTMGNFSTQLISTLATGTAPLAVASTTPVTSLMTEPITYNHSGTQNVNTTIHSIIDTGLLSGGTLTVTLTGSSVFTSGTSYNCNSTDTTTPANVVKPTQTSGSSITFTGTATDAFTYQCWGY